MMELEDLGFDRWFRQHWTSLQKPGMNVARITRVERDRCLVRNEQDEVPAEPAGKLLYAVDSTEELPCVGDWAIVQYYNEGASAIIHDLFPRRTFLRRKAAGKRVEFQMIAANIDTAFIMQSCDNNFNIRRMERYLVMVNDGRIEPVILLSKSDLIPPDVLEQKVADIRQAHINATVIPFSSVTGDGLDTLRQALKKSKTYCLLGSSGVGKTTLLNHLLGAERFETATVREKDGRGRHTTTNRQMTVLDNGALLIDTPGMRELGMLAASSGLDDSFADIIELASACRFTDCSHTVETGCAILAALGSGELADERYQSYRKLLKESQFHQMSYIEKRRRDKEFGKMVKNVMKEVKQRKR